MSLITSAPVFPGSNQGRARQRSSGLAGGHKSKGRPRRQIAWNAALMMGGDALAVLCALVLALSAGLQGVPFEWPSLHAALSAGTASIWSELVYLLWFILALLVMNQQEGIYSLHPAQTTLHEQRKSAQSCLTAGLLLCGAIYMTHATISRAVVAYLVGFTALFLGAFRVIRRLSMYRMYDEGIETSNVLVLGTSPIGEAIRKQMAASRHLGRMFRGFVDLHSCDEAPCPSSPFAVGSLGQLRTLVRQHFIDELIIAETVSTPVVVDLVDLARELDIEVLVIPGFYDGLSPESHIEYIGDFPVAPLHRRESKAVSKFFKRSFDFSASLIALALLAPTMLLLALAIKLDSHGPVFYVSDRIGKKGRVFRILKFRTMVPNADQLKDTLKASNERDGVLFKIKNDPRITRVGRFLRKYSLDELPQLINVLRGEMSVVGPRPPLSNEVQMYQAEHFRRLEVLPGLTGLWQVRARQESSFEKGVALDLTYVENWNLWLDLKIILRTAEVVLRGTGY